MKTLTALFAAAALAVGANVALADVPAHEISGLEKAGTVQSLQKLAETAKAKHPGSTITDSELENEYGRYILKVELRDAQNVEWDVDLDAKTGEVLKDKQDT
ncbi:PepSY domain-containing protein [Pseudomonas sp. SWRI59]|uniref:PepSY domain-containing protein n=1 Tax=Pseudomonas TaxID=286 RepID=UPI0016457D9F|nr:MULTISPECIES: PepSY domain-containing protein [unclassified Pseudomonas]MBC3480459.1 PepSY domain-containing protein [Pseudomonas sp. SWRI77]MBC3501915.1 PepSY domain-containing protein [Pseudomonas sp. SWRI59]MBC3505996.1 PepSY domain-containing protein [Pseudomonas sp. SWRI68]UVL02242.1 PepSY domain-containing protein [Pseudomonas sp. B21-047]